MRIYVVADLKVSNPVKWYSKIKRMGGNDPNNQGSIIMVEQIGLSNHDQAEVITDHYCKISNQYDPIDEEDFKDYIKNLDSSPLKI